MKIELQFKTLADAEAFLTRQGFKPVPETCNWRSDAGGEAGCYPIEREPYGTVEGFRVEVIIKRKKAPH